MYISFNNVFPLDGQLACAYGIDKKFAVTPLVFPKMACYQVFKEFYLCKLHVIICSV